MILCPSRYSTLMAESLWIFLENSVRCHASPTNNGTWWKPWFAQPRGHSSITCYLRNISEWQYFWIIQCNLSLWPPRRWEHHLMWTQFHSPFSVFYIMKRPLRCEHNFPAPFVSFTLWKDLWDVNTISQPHLCLLHYEKISEMWTQFPSPLCIVYIIKKPLDIVNTPYCEHIAIVLRCSHLWGFTVLSNCIHACLSMVIGEFLI